MTTFNRNVPPPFSARMVKTRRPGYKAGEDSQEGLITDDFADYFTAQGATLDGMAVKEAHVSLTGQQASIGATDFTGSALSTGCYRLSVYLYTEVAGGAGTLELTIDWTTIGAARTSEKYTLDATSAAAMVAGPPIYFLIDGGTPVLYTTTNGSAPPFSYGLELHLEQVPS